MLWPSQLAENGSRWVRDNHLGAAVVRLCMAYRKFFLPSRIVAIAPAIFALTHAARAQTAPVADVHFHYLGAAATTASLRTMDSLGVTLAVVMGTPAQLAELQDDARIRFVRSLTLPCFGGRMPNAGVQCYADNAEWPSVDSVRAMVIARRVQMLGEINAQYGGVRVDDARLDPYFALAEELDIPVGVHLGIGPPGVSYADSPNPAYKSPAYSGAAGDPMALDGVLRRHPRLRVYVMHAAWPMRDAMLYMLYMHPRLHVDVSVLQYAIPRPAYEDYLHDLVNAGFASRIMFGSDGSARRVREGIDAIRTMSFLTPELQRAILSENAERFFKTSR